MDTIIRLHAAVSLDGFCADQDGGVDWLAPFQSDDTAVSIFQVQADALVMGRATYDQVRGFADQGIPWPYPGKRVFVLTSRPLDAAPPPGVVAMADVNALLDRLRARPLTVWLVGGPATVRSLLDAGAVREIELFIVPVLLGQGHPLLTAERVQNLTLMEQETYRSGMVRLLYAVTPSG